MRNYKGRLALRNFSRRNGLFVLSGTGASPAEPLEWVTWQVLSLMEGFFKPIFFEITHRKRPEYPQK